VPNVVNEVGDGAARFVHHQPQLDRLAVGIFNRHLRVCGVKEQDVAGRMNVEVSEVLDAAKESIRTGAAVELPEK